MTGRVDQVPQGPALLRGAEVVRDLDGSLHQVERPVVAICVCGLCQRRPWCDGTHKVARRDDDAPLSLEVCGSYAAVRAG